MHQRLFAVSACLLVVCFLLIAITGCRSLTQIAPPADEHLASKSNTPLAALQRGRDLYLTKCAACHVAEPVHDYSAAQWATILPAMNEEAKFNAAQAADVKAYIDACLAMPASSP